MPVFHFDAVLTVEPDEAQIDAVFEACEGDPPTLSVRAGTPYAMFTVEASALTDAFRAATRGLRAAGLDVAHFEVEPEAVEA